MFGSSSTSAATYVISVLFSEPKIPQFPRNRRRLPRARQGFSALQRAENSSIDQRCTLVPRPCEFQCSSASRKFLNRYTWRGTTPRDSVSVLFSEPKIPQRRSGDSEERLLIPFSALQRAENSSKRLHAPPDITLPHFQCSSASRKFLKQRCGR